jgi:hypothetical protein
MRKLLTAFSSERELKGCRVRLCTGRDGSARGSASALGRAGLCACPETGAVAGGVRDGGRTPCDGGARAAGPSAAGTRRFRAAYLTVWGVPERRTALRDRHVPRVEAVRQGCLAAVLQAKDDEAMVSFAASVDGLQRLLQCVRRVASRVYNARGEAHTARLGACAGGSACLARLSNESERQRYHR